MKNAPSIIAITFVVGLSLLPPINFYITNFSNDYWTWMICVAGFLGVLTLFIQTNVFVRVMAVGGFINCFFSIAPYISFTAYVSLVGCCYLYIFCQTIRNWDLVFKMLQAVAVFNIILMALQFLGHDQLLNFSQGRAIDQFGGIGQHMRMGSFAAILTALLVFVSPWWCIFAVAFGLFCKSTWTIVAVGAGVFFINKKVFLVILTVGVLSCLFLHKIYQFKASSGRLPVWSKTVELANKRPIMGVGIGTYKLVFAPLAKLNESIWRTAHNCWLQILFEAGYPGLIFSIVMFLFLFYRLCLIKDLYGLAGLAIISTDMVAHFPTRMMNTVPLIILFLAYCEQRIKIWTPQPQS